MIPTDTLNKAEQIANAATLGPWSYDDDEAEIHSDVMCEYGGDPYHIVKGDGSIPVNDAKFIAHFNPAFCLKLIEEIRTLRNTTDRDNRFFESGWNSRALHDDYIIDEAIELIKYPNIKDWDEKANEFLKSIEGEAAG